MSVVNHIFVNKMWSHSLVLKGSSWAQMKLYTLAVLSEHKRPKVSVKLKHPSVYMELLILPQIKGFYYLFFLLWHSLWVAWVHLEFIIYISMTPNLQKSSCPSFSRSGIVGMYHHTSHGFKSDFLTLSFLGHFSVTCYYSIVSYTLR